MFELLNETLFEKHIAEYLAGSKMYNQRTPKDFNIQKLVDSDMLLQFLREQPMWQKLITQTFTTINFRVDSFNHNVERILFVYETLSDKFLPHRLLAQKL